MIKPRFLTLLSSLLIAGDSLLSATVGTVNKETFSEYWYTKGAEISRFVLNQSRYGEIHTGDAVLIFVTEGMNPKLQVKADSPGTSTIPILKLNATRKFYTGIYPYSIMTSVFSPVELNSPPLPQKITFSSQEWCGQVFMQMNLKDNQFLVQSRSYFEDESDREFNVEKVLCEDGLWTQIRMAPQKLPTGEFNLLPGTAYTRLLHRRLSVNKVVGKMTDAAGQSLEGNPLIHYEIQFAQEGRILKITFEREFPYRIQEWEDSHKTIFGGKNLTTHAIRTHTIMTDYWNKHQKS